MATGDTAARNERADNFATDYATANLVMKQGATTLATYTLAGFAAAVNGVINTNAVPDANPVADGTADNAEFTNGTGTYTLTVGLTGSGADVESDDLSFSIGIPKPFAASSITFPAS